MSIIRNFSVTITVAGTPVPLTATRAPAAWVIIQAAKNNAGSVYIGGSEGGQAAPTNGTTTTNAIELAKGDSLTLPSMGIADSYNLAGISANADTNGDKVRVIYGRA